MDLNQSADTALHDTRLASWSLDLQTGCFVCSEGFDRMFGFTAHVEDKNLNSLLQNIVEDDLEAVRCAFEHATSSADEWRLQFRVRQCDGSIRTVCLLAGQLMDELGNASKLVGIIEDISTQREMDDSLRMTSIAVANSAEGFMLLDEYGQVLMVNTAYVAITGYAASSVIGKLCLIVPGPESEQRFHEISNILVTSTHYVLEDCAKNNRGDEFHFLANISRCHDHEGNAEYYVVVFQDISNRKALNLEQEYLATHDALTGLPNRILLVDRGSAAVRRTRRHDDFLALLFLDLDRFKTINDSLGHKAGDQLLVSVAKRLCGTVRDTDTVARLGGDEFMIILDELKAPGEAAMTAQKILDALTRPFDLMGLQVHVSGSVGIACYPSDGEDFESLMHNSDLAMYGAKQQGRNRYQYFSPDLNVNALRTLNVQNAMHQALQHNEFRLHYQPIVNVHTGEISGVEALIRWHSPELGVVAPSEFIPMAEETGLILPIGDWLLQEAINQIRVFQASGHSALRVAVNLSPRQFKQVGFVQRVAELLQQAQVNPACLTLEVTETIMMHKVSQAQCVLSALHGLGVKIALDDFGTGYSSLKHLKTFQIHYIKIDKSFVDGLPGDLADFSIVQAITAMAHSFGAQLIAEGVETEQQFITLRDLQCEEVQGYLFSMPLQAEDVLWLLDHHPHLPVRPPTTYSLPH